jgi:hypothetical protein
VVEPLSEENNPTTMTTTTTIQQAAGWSANVSPAYIIAIAEAAAMLGFCASIAVVEGGI